MKSPKDLSTKLARQWRIPDIREQRLLTKDGWPVRLSIGRPPPREISENLDQVRSHLKRWRDVTVGKVTWGSIVYRSTSEAVEVPLAWELSKPSEWIDATGSKEIKDEFQRLGKVVGAVDPMFHSLLVRQRNLVLERPTDEVIKASELALLLEPECAGGAPLRALSYGGIDSKFFERNRALLTNLLDVRFGGVVGESGLESFLGAFHENDHWLLVADLDGTALPFKQIRVRDSELFDASLSVGNVLVVENERCLHHLPQLPNTVAILGAGLNLSWLQASWLSEKQIAYWGDIDTWGLTMLARARRLRPSLVALLMTEMVYDRYSPKSSVPEPKTAGINPPTDLTEDEKHLYLRLLSEEKGRLEQEFIPKEEVINSLVEWNSGNG